MAESAPNYFRKAEILSTLSVLRDKQPLRAVDIFNYLKSQGSTISRSTVCILLARLTQKGWLIRRHHPDNDHVWYYRTRDNDGEMAGHALGLLLDRFFVTDAAKIAFLKRQLKRMMDSSNCG